MPLHLSWPPVRDTTNSLSKIEFLPTPFMQTTRIASRSLNLTHAHPTHHDLCLTSMPLFYFLTFLAAIPWIVSATRTRSPALNNSAGRPTLNSLDKASGTKTKSSELRIKPWCTPTLTFKAVSSLHPRFCQFILIHCFFTNTIHSSTPSYLSEHQLNHLIGHHFKRFLRINKGHPQDWSSFFARYFPSVDEI